MVNSKKVMVPANDNDVPLKSMVLKQK